MADDDSILSNPGDYVKTQEGVNSVIQATRADLAARSAAQAAKPLPQSEIQRLKDNDFAFSRPRTD